MDTYHTHAGLYWPEVKGFCEEYVGKESEETQRGELPSTTGLAISHFISPAVTTQTQK